MSQANKKQSLPTLSREFAARLDSLGAKQMVRAVVMLRTSETGAAESSRPRGQQRAEVIEKVRQASQVGLPDIDRVIEQFGGKRLSEDADALGSIIIETTAEGIRALAASVHVKAILEDQSIFRLLQPQS
jgi:hypothetical protein